MAGPVSGASVDKAIRVALNGLSVRQKTIGNNLSNVDTPGFKASEVRFEEQLQSAISRAQASPGITLAAAHPRHIATGPGDVEGIKPQLVRQNSTARVDGNSVDIDKEMVELAQTAISYNALVQLAGSRISLARYAVNEGRR